MANGVRNDDVLRVPTVSIKANDIDVIASVGLTPPTELTSITSDKTTHGDAVSRIESGHSAPYCFDDASGFMTGNYFTRIGVTDMWITVIEAHICPAKRRRFDTDTDVKRADLGKFPVFNLYPLITR